MRVLVTDAAERKSLAAVRALGRAGAEVFAVGSSPLDQALHSRWCAGRLVWPSPQTQPWHFLCALEGALQAGGFDVLLPMGDHSTATAVRHARRLSAWTHLAVPAPAAYAEVACKWRLAGLAGRLGIPAPITHRPECESDLQDVAASMSYPCVVKPVRGAGAAGFWLAGTREELLARYPCGEAFHDRVFDHRWPLVQEYVRGRTHEVCALADRGRLVAAVTQRRLRSYPPEAGPGILNETTDEPDLVAVAARLVEAVGWHGPLQVEFLRGQDDGRPLLIEVNPRFWGTLDLSVRAGVDLPLLTCLLALGVLPPGPHRGPRGVRYAWLLPYALIALREGRRKETGLEALFAEALHTDIDPRDWGPHAAQLARAAGRGIWRLCRP
jgi:predicted ATP-grasp superfamily ATP-dependent carboligase